MELTYLIGGALTLLGIILSIVLIIVDKKLTKSEKLHKIKDLLPQIIVTVEEAFGRGNGKLKKQYALSEIQQQCIAEHIKLSQNDLNDLSQSIEDIMSTPQKKTTN